MLGGNAEGCTDDDVAERAVGASEPSGDDMGRHSTLEVDCPTEAIKLPAPGWGAGQREIDLGGWWRAAGTKARFALVVALATPVVGVVTIATAASGPSDYEIATAAASSAQSEGASYGAELRDEGYNGISIESNCMVNAGGYSGDHFEDYMTGCYGVGMQVSERGG